jgi:hypothetical protein
VVAYCPTIFYCAGQGAVPRGGNSQLVAAKRIGNPRVARYLLPDGRAEIAGTPA